MRTRTDVNGDGKNDVVVADEGTNQIGVLLNSATAGTLTGPTVYAAGTAPSGVVLDNYTGHVPTTALPAVLDAAVSNDSTTSGGVTLLTNNGTGVLTAKATYPTSAAQIAVTDGNFDGTLSRLAEQHRRHHPQPHDRGRPGHSHDGYL